MGWGGEGAYGVRVLLDEHGGEKEVRHQQLWEELQEQLGAAVRGVIADPKFEELRPEIW
jgi:hypothetical protein